MGKKRRSAMWKFSCLVFSLLTIGDCSTHERAGTTEISRNVRNYENQRRNYEARSIEDDENASLDGEDYSRADSDEFEGEKLIGKWRNSGSALEPKWRDGDSLPLVPFDSAKQGNFRHQEDVRDGSRLPETRDDLKAENRDEQIEKIPISYDSHFSSSRDENEGYSLDKNSSKRHDGEKNGFSRREKSSKLPATSHDDSLRSLVPKLAARAPTEKENKKLLNGLDDMARSRYRDMFQTHPNEYELNDEEYQKPRPRKRRPPQNYEFSEIRAPTYSITWSTERYTETVRNSDKVVSRSTIKPEVTTRRRIEEKRNSSRRVETSNSRRATENSELKTLLKMQQTEGLSLSELLQRRNLTLNDLLKGKPEVLNVLKASDSNEDDYEITGIRKKFYEPDKMAATTERTKWLTSQAAILTNTNSTHNEISTIAKIVDEDKSDSPELESNEKRTNENEKLSAIVRLTKPIILPRSNIVEKTTKKTITIEDSLENYQNDENLSRDDDKMAVLDDDEIMEFSDFTTNKKISTTTIMPEETTTNGYVKFDDLDENLGSTLSIENILSRTEQTAINLPNEVSNVDARVNSVGNESNMTVDIFGTLDSDYQSDEPREIIVPEETTSSDNDSRENTTIVIEEFFESEKTARPSNHQIFETEKKPYEIVISEIEPEARAEIFELFSSGSSAQHLERLLKSRNMSIDELIELRQRGSSRVHLAEVTRAREDPNFHPRHHNDEIFHKSFVEDTTRLVTSITSDDLSNIEIDSTSYETTEPDTTVTNVASIGTERIRHDSVTLRNDENNQPLLELLKAFDSLPFSPETVRSENRSRTKITIPTTSHVEVGLVQEIIEETSGIVDRTETNIRMNYSTGTSNDKKNGERKSLSKVRPSIIASGAILGVTIVVFLAIFVVCRVRQKQKYTYRNTFSRAVFQGPTMTARKLSNSSSLNTIMVNVVATSTTKRPERRENRDIDDNFEAKNDIENDSLDANDSWETIPDFMK